MTRRTFDTPGRVHLRVDTRAGSVRLSTHDDPSTVVEVTAVEPGAEDLVARTRVAHIGTDGRHRVEIEVPTPDGGGLLRGLLGRGGGVAIVVHLPPGSTLEVTGKSSGVVAEGRYGQARLATASGNVSVEDVDGDLRVETASGAVRIGAVGGRVTVSTASGAVHCRTLTGPGELTTASGDVTVQAAGGHLTVGTASGSVHLGRLGEGCRVRSASGGQSLDRVGAGRVQLDSVSGDLSIAVLRGTAVDVDAQTVTGHLTSDIELDGPAEVGAAEVRAAEGPQLTIEARTVTGDVGIERAEAAGDLVG